MPRFDDDSDNSSKEALEKNAYLHDSEGDEKEKIGEGVSSQFERVKAGEIVHGHGDS